MSGEPDALRFMPPKFMVPRRTPVTAMLPFKSEAIADPD
jgi:hypothetical protein